MDEPNSELDRFGRGPGDPMTWSCLNDVGGAVMLCIIEIGGTAETGVAVSSWVVCSALADAAVVDDDRGDEGGSFEELVILRLPPVTHRTQSIPWIG